ncbi:imidazolonepropionase [Ruegeria arenilitoris]|uniref:imidazolonepropionase n=1 Tax=Ruegeria arenilitoris TaxID=1173585 RepID=UPI00147F37E5|nr:imidazolonepropionase [Ruegeria arenilitoris]
MTKKLVLQSANIATMQDGKPYGLIRSGSIAIEGEHIAWVGETTDEPKQYRDWPRDDFGERLISPGLIDAHTHVIYGGNRAREFEMRLNGATYEEVARAGGGILSTVKATRSATEDDLLTDALPRVDALIAEGVTCIEVKSGYGLDKETELRMLRAARRIQQVRPVRIKTTFLGAHAIPPEYSGNGDAYIAESCIPAMQEAYDEGLVDAVDGFCETIAFTPEQITHVFEEALKIGLPIKLHAEQLSNLGGATLAASYGALSADHLEYLDEDGVSAMARAGTVAMLLPGAFYTLRETQYPPVELFRKYKVPMALATDCNPGSSPLTSLLLVMNMGCTLFRMTPSEAMAAVTRNAALGLGIMDTGVIAPGNRADLAVWDVTDPAELSYRVGFNPLHKRIFGGYG